MRLLKPHLLLLFWLPAWAGAQTDSSALADVQLFLETGSFSWTEDRITEAGRPYLPFAFAQESEVVEVLIKPAFPQAITGLAFLPGADMVLLDSLIQLDSATFRTRLRLDKLTRNDGLALTFQVALRQGDTVNTLIPLFPYTETQTSTAPQDYVLYLGEETIIPIQALQPANIRPQPVWQKTPQVAYRLTIQNGQVQLHLIPLSYGTHRLSIPYRTFRPRRDSLSGRFLFNHTIAPFEIEVKRGKVPFLDLGVEELYLTQGARYAAKEISMEQKLALNVRQTYRIEDQERSGGNFIGELYVREIESSGKMRAQLRAYDVHRRNEGPLYIKSSDGAIFVTNFSVIPAPTIEEVYVRRAGGEWTKDLFVMPGDSFDLRVDGQSLHALPLTLKGFAPADSQQARDRFVATGFFLPANHKARSLVVMADGQPTPYQIPVREYARPRAMDFVSVRVQSRRFVYTTLPARQRVYGSLSDIEVLFDRDMIEKAGDLYGPQHLEVSISLWDAEGRQLEEEKSTQIIILPGEASPRHGRYQVSDAFEGTLSLKSLLNMPLDELPGWARIRVRIAHQNRVYPEGGQDKEVEFVLARKVYLAAEVSFPMAIIMNRFGSGSEVLNSLNFGAFLQMGLYRDQLIRQPTSIRLHLGVLSTDVLPFRGDGMRDLGVATFMSILPLDATQRWNIPIYLGGGYLTQAKTGFFFMGPGVSMTF